MRNLAATLLAALAAFGAWAESVYRPGEGYKWTDRKTDITWTYQRLGGAVEISNERVATSAISYGSGSSSLKELIIPSKINGEPVTSIGEYALANAVSAFNPQSVTIPNSVTNIGKQAFQNCNGLTDVNIPDGVTDIGWEAFYGCSSLTNMIVGNGVRNIGLGAFWGCSGLASVTIPSSVTNIGGSAFRDCNRLVTVHINDLAAWCRISFGPDDGNPLYHARNLILNGSKIADLAIPDGVEKIGWYTFCNCSCFTSVTIPNSVKSIASRAFYGCCGLKNVVIGNGVTYIGPAVFSGCTELTSVTFLGNAPSVEPNGFNDVSADCIVYVSHSSTGWGVEIPGTTWNGLRIEYIEAEEHLANYCLILKPNSSKCGSASGSGMYAVGVKATIKAKAKKGYVFAGWFTDKACKKALNPKGYDNRKLTVKYAMPAKNTTVYAKFVTKAAAKKSLKFSSATKKLAKTAKKATAGKNFELALGISSASLPTFTAKGLPKGLSIDKATGKITGVGTVPGSFTATVTVKDAAGNKITQTVKITVNVPSWAKGTFYGLAYPGVKSEDSWAYLKFTAAKAGKVSGKVTYNGKSYSFTSSYKSCTASKATFSPKIKIGSKAFKPGTVTVKTQNVDGLKVVAATDKYGFATAQKKSGLVKKGKPLAALVGERLTFTKNDANSGLFKTKDMLVVTLGNDDAVTVSGVVGGKKFAPISWVALVADPYIGSWSINKPAYTLYVDIIDAALKYERTLVLQVYFDNDGQPRVNAKFQ